jgi:hypothetical protein
MNSSAELASAYIVKNRLVLPDALRQCVIAMPDKLTSPVEEAGGVILSKGDEFKFIRLANKHTGTVIARVLYEVDPWEYGDKVLPILFDGWFNHSSIHTHPQFQAFPSDIDIYRLFPGFGMNFIYSQKHKQLNAFIGKRFFKV